MKTTNRIRAGLSLAALLAGLALAITPASAVDRYWDGGTSNIASNGDGASAGGAGTWNTTLLNWDVGAVPHVAWNNAGNDTAIFAGTAGAVTLGEAIGVTNITFAAGSLGTSQYIIGGNTLNFSAGGLISNLNGTSGQIQTITSAITGAPSVNQITSSAGGDITGGIKFAPTSGAVQHLGTVTLAAGYPGSTGGADKTTLWLSGTTTGNTLSAVNQNTNYSLIRKSDSGSWTVTGVAKFGRLYLEGGSLIVTGTLQGTLYQGPYLNSGTLYYNSPGAVYTGTNFANSTVFIFNGGNLDQTSGAPITTSTYNPYMDWRASFTFIGSNGANSDLNLGTGLVRMITSPTVTVSNALTTLTVGGAISGNYGLSKAGPGTLALKGNNTYIGDTNVSEGMLSLRGGSQTSTITVNSGATLALTVGSPVTSSAGLNFAAGSKVRIIGTPGVPSYTLLTTTGLISGTLALEPPIPEYNLFVEAGNTLKLAKNTDTDGDTLPDWWEQLYTTPPSTTGLNPGDDLDSDGLTNLQEFQRGTNPIHPDTDTDGLLDGVETKTGIWVSAANTGTDPLKSDTDGDGFKDGAETNTGTWVSAANTGSHPLVSDSDGDGLIDGAETNTGTYLSASNTGTNPNKSDSDGDGANDWYEINASFTKPSDAASKSPVPYPLPAPDGSTGTTSKPVKVYIMSGQSNMVGYGRVDGTESGTLQTFVKTQGKFPNLLGPGGSWAVRNDVQYRGMIAATGKAPLAPGFGDSSMNLSFGPELGFGHVMGWYHDEPVLIIKSSQGGRALGWDFLPPGSTQFTSGTTTYAGYGESPGSWTTGTTPLPDANFYGGYQFDQCFLRKADWAPAGSALAAVFNVTDVLDNFATEYPQYAAQGFEIAGFVWWQGWNDGLSYTTQYANRYEQNMAQFIRKIREYYVSRYPGKIAPKAPFVLATAAFDGFNSAYPTRTTVANAQLAVDGDAGNYPEFADNVKTMEARGYWRTSGPSNQNYHYYHNAETYMLVSDALGRGMVELLIGADYATWTKNYPAADLTEKDADIDGDGLSNDHERLWGLNPTSAASCHPVTFTPGLATGAFNYTRRTRALTGMSYTVWTSTDLAAWTQDSGAVQTPGAAVNDVETVAVTLTPALLSAPRLFVQMRAAP